MYQLHEGNIKIMFLIIATYLVLLPFLKEREGYMTKQGAQVRHVRYTKVQMKMRLFSGC